VLRGIRCVDVCPLWPQCMCGECAEVLRFQSNKCPICRHAVEGLLQIKISQRKDAIPEDLLAPDGAPTAADAPMDSWHRIGSRQQGQALLRDQTLELSLMPPSPFPVQAPPCL